MTAQPSAIIRSSPIHAVDQCRTSVVAGRVRPSTNTHGTMPAATAPTLKALAHPLRQKMLRALDSHGEANSTTIAKALGENTGTTSYHLRVLADAGIIEYIPEHSTGRERWYRTVPTDRRAPEYDSLPEEDKAAYDAWTQLRIPDELRLAQRMVDEYNKHGKWLNLSRSSAYYTVDDLEALFEDYISLLNKYGHSREDAPPNARRLHLRFFYLPDENQGA